MTVLDLLRVCFWGCIAGCGLILIAGTLWAWRELFGES